MKPNLIILKKAFLFLLLFFNSRVNAQEPNGRFLEDTLAIGKTTQFELVFKHPSNINIFFPTDEKYFKPYGLINVQGFTTKTVNEISTDVVLYDLKSFEINRIQYLSLPVFISNGKDCTVVYSKVDSIFSLQKINDSRNVEAKSSLNFIKLDSVIDFPKILMVLGVILFGLFFIYLIFGRTINRYIKLFKLKRQHREFISSYEKLTKGEINEKKVSKALVLWKKHMQLLENKPFTTFTSKEINEELLEENLAEALKDFDMAIYANVLNIKMPDSMKVLKAIAYQTYKNRWEQLSSDLKQR